MGIKQNTHFLNKFNIKCSEMNKNKFEVAEVSLVPAQKDWLSSAPEEDIFDT